MPKMLKVVSLFSGGGGLDLGFAAAGFDIVYANDVDPYSCRTLLLNQGRKNFYGKHVVVTDDVANVSGKSIFGAAQAKPGDIDFVIGGPPCQSFSVFGRRRGLGDPRGNLIWEYSRIINDLKPKGFLFENVPGLKSIESGKVIEQLKKTLSFGGKYHIDINTYRMVEHGIPQFRERVLIVGNRLERRIPLMEGTHGDVNLVGSENLLAYRTAGEVLRHMPQPSETSGLNNHIGRVHSSRIRNRYENLIFGERDPKTRINKIDPSRPSFTIIVGSDHGGGKGHVHPYSPREVTPRESARIQTFPDWWEFDGRGRHVIRQVGNAVPPLFAIQIASHIKKQLFNTRTVPSYTESINQLGIEFMKIYDHGPVQS